MAASSSSAAADPSLLKYDVFISFRGETRNSFTSHLYSALRQKHINAYLDEVSLAKGDDISRALPKAIEESAISIIIFSENYADSRWCLDELVHILKCKEDKDQIVLPIFYGIDPSHIRHQKGTYAAAFVKHQGRFKDEMEKVEEWRQALTRAADLSGWDSQGKSESVLVQEVVEDVMRKLQSISSTSIDDLKGLFGIHEQLREIESLLCVDSTNVCSLGIWGMGGIGKTTLARVIFKRFSNRFEGTCFLESVREQSQRKGLVELEKEVFSKLLGEKDPDVSNPFVNVRLSRTKALLVLDDIDDFKQLDRLAGHRDRFGLGSKIIVTSRDLQVLKQVMDVRYEVQALDLNEAFQLFYLKAFRENSCRTGYEEMSAKVVRFTGGNPLALQVLGLYLKSLGIKEWESALEKLKRIPHVNIQKVLRISYDGLDTEEQDIFLDIACFLKDEKKDFVEGILGHKSIIAITVLDHKSLITIDQDGFIRMHDLIQEMGWEIVRQSTKKLGKRSRLWTAEVVSNVLENNKGTEAIEGIYLPWIKEVHLRPDVFEEMTNLRLLKISDALGFWNVSCTAEVYIDGDLKYLPNGLRYLHWEKYPGKSLPSNFKPRNLVELNMRSSKLEQLWDGVQELGSLKLINLSRSNLLTKLPDLSLAPKLKNLDLSLCKSLENKQFISLLSNINLTALEELDLEGTSIQELPSTIGNLTGLRDLNLNSCELLEFTPETLGKLTRLQFLVLSKSSKLERFPMLLGACSLTQLFLSYCNIREIPDWLGSLTSLTVLELEGNIFDGIPASIRRLDKLKRLGIRNCKNLKSLPKLPLFIQSVNADSCSSLKIVSTSISTLGRCLHKYYTDSYDDKREFTFVNCTNLDEDAIKNIFREFLFKVFCTAITPLEVIDSEGVTDELLVRYPTKKIPRWFNNRSERSFITFALPQNWYNPKTFLGFVVSVVVAERNLCDQPIICEVCLETNCGESLEEFEYEIYLHDSDLNYSELNPFELNSYKLNSYELNSYKLNSYEFLKTNHMIVGYKYFDHSRANFEKYQEASFKFDSGLWLKQCGVRMLYLKDAVDESDDGTAANFESWIIDVIGSDNATTSDSDEPPRKRTWNLRQNERTYQSGGSDEDDQSCGSDEDYRSCGSYYATTSDSDEPPHKRTRNLRQIERTYQSCESDEDDQSCGN